MYDGQNPIPRRVEALRVILQASQKLAQFEMNSSHKQNKGKSDYFSAGKPVHRLSYCAFLDVLGFSERVRASYKDGSADKLLKSFHQVLATSIAQFKEDADESTLYFKSFTDNVVLAYPGFSEDMESSSDSSCWPSTSISSRWR